MYISREVLIRSDVFDKFFYCFLFKNINVRLIKYLLLNDFNKDKRFKFFLLESFNRAITRQSAFERFYLIFNVLIFFC